MTSSFRKTVEKLNEQAQGFDLAPCMRCATATQRTTLAKHGGMCFTCFEAYCREPQPPAPARQPRTSTPSRDVPFDPVTIESAKRDQQRRVDEYARARGIQLP